MGDARNIDWRKSVASTLEWWEAVGVDTLTDDHPRDWLARVAPAPPPSTQPVPGDGGSALPDTLAAFEAWRVSDAAPDAGWSPRRIGPAGNAASGLMVLIEMPDREDVDAGMLIAGAPGRLFDRMLAAIGRDRQSIYLASLCAARHPTGRVPADAMAELTRLACHHIALVRPPRLLVIGNAASRALTGMDVAHARETLHSFNHAGGTTELIASFHPRFLIERPIAKGEAWKDLQMLTKGLDG